MIIKWWWSRWWWRLSCWWCWRRWWCLWMNQGNGGQKVKSVLSFQFAARILPMRDTRFHWSIVGELKGKIPFTEEGEDSSNVSIGCTHHDHCPWETCYVASRWEDAGIVLMYEVSLRRKNSLVLLSIIPTIEKKKCKFFHVIKSFVCVTDIKKDSLLCIDVSLPLSKMKT